MFPIVEQLVESVEFVLALDLAGEAELTMQLAAPGKGLSFSEQTKAKAAAKEGSTLYFHQYLKYIFINQI
jgi:hypothetical protein